MLGSQLDDRQRVLDATDIVQLVGEHVALKARGREFVGLCPFHDDHKPSMYVVPAKQIFHCFSCGAGGNALTFVMDYHKMAFREALELLAQRAGVELTPGTHDASKLRGDGKYTRADLLAANRSAADFFQTILAHAEHGAAAREIIARRGISEEMVREFRLGAAPDLWDGLCRTIAHKRLGSGAFESAGLIKPRSDGSHYDAFRNRLMFPIQDQTGAVIAFGARRTDDEDEPKYLNSPESIAFNKSATLYGLHQAARAIQRSRMAIVTEGYMDVIACHQAGVQNVVATLGTALTSQSAKVLQRLCDTVVLLFDGDEAGQKAADRAVEVFFAVPVDVRIATLADAEGGAKDPDELLKQEGGRERFNVLIDGARDALSFRLGRLRGRMAGLGLSARAKLVEEAMARLVDLGLNEAAPIRRQLIIRQMAAALDVDEDTLRAGIPRRRSRADAEEDGEASGRAAPLSAPALLLGCVLADPALVLSLQDGADELRRLLGAQPGPLGHVIGTVCELLGDGEASEMRLQDVLARLEDAAAQRLATRVCEFVTSRTDMDRDRLHELWRTQLALARRATREPDEENRREEPSDDDDWIARIQRAQQNYQALGENPAALPTGGR